MRRNEVTEEWASDGELLHDIDHEVGTKMAENEVGIVLAIFRWIMPPKMSDPPEVQHFWKWRITLLLWTLLPISALSMFVSYKFLFVDGFARQSDVATFAAQTNAHFSTTDQLMIGMRTDLHALRVRNMSDQLFALRVQISRDKSDDDKARDCKQFTALSQQYENLTSKSYGFEPTACDNL